MRKIYKINIFLFNFYYYGDLTFVPSSYLFIYVRNAELLSFYICQSLQIYMCVRSKKKKIKWPHAIWKLNNEIRKKKLRWWRHIVLDLAKCMRGCGWMDECNEQIKHRIVLKVNLVPDFWPQFEAMIRWAHNRTISSRKTKV